MPLIYIDLNDNVGQVKERFYKETGLVLEIIYHGKTAENTLLIDYLQKGFLYEKYSEIAEFTENNKDNYDENPFNRVCFERLLEKGNPYSGCFILNFKDSIQFLKDAFFCCYALEVKVRDSAGKEFAGSEILENILENRALKIKNQEEKILEIREKLKEARNDFIRELVRLRLEKYALDQVYTDFPGLTQGYINNLSGWLEYEMDLDNLTVKMKEQLNLKSNPLLKNYPSSSVDRRQLLDYFHEDFIFNLLKKKMPLEDILRIQSLNIQLSLTIEYESWKEIKTI